MQNEADNIPVRDRETTILFTDVEGSTELRSRRGDRVADEILALHERIVRAAIEHHAGVEVSFLGDGFMASFSEARDAVRCALAIEEALDDHNSANPDRSLRVRIGVHTGEVSERDGTMYGQTVHAASRITFEATGGQILISSLVRDRVEHDPELT